MKRIKGAIVMLVIILCGCYLWAGMGLEKHPLDKSESRTLVLPNKMKVILISDPDFNKSAAALDVLAGALSDPRDKPGMAHFTEHMLFINTKKYPEVDAFNKYLSNNGGYRNGYTAGANTNFHFEIHHDALEEALDRFAQFFVGPLFTEKYTEREMHAVDSEHKKNLMADGRREYQLFRNFCKPRHPMNGFSTGNLETLKKVGHQEMVDFYKKHYSANRMSLTILSDNSLDELERLARKYFEEVPNHDLPDIIFEPEYIVPADSFRCIKYIPVKDLRRISLEFGLPGILDQYRHKPTYLIGTCLGHEGEGSLLSYLKAKGWATGLRAGGYPYCSSFSSFAITISLTEKGLADYKEVVQSCFAYIGLIKEKGIPDYIFREAQAMARLDFKYTDKGEGSRRSSTLAAMMNRYPLDLVQEVNYYYESISHDLNKKMLSYLRPDNMLCILASKSVKADTVGKYYGTEYTYSAEAGEYFKSLANPPAISELQLPAANPYVPRKIGLLAERPVKIVQEKGMELWYSQDTEFKRPKVLMTFHVQLPAKNVNVGYLTAMRFYSACINEQLNELTYPASEAGLHYALSGGGKGVSLVVGGYDNSALILLDSILVQLKQITLDEERFAGIKDRIIRGLKNYEKNQAYQVARLLARKIRKKDYYSPRDVLPQAQKMTLADVKKFTKSLYKSVYLWGLVHGNMETGQAKQAINKVARKLKAKPLPESQVFKHSMLEQPRAEVVTYTEALETNNSCMWRLSLLGEDTPKIRAAAKIINNYVDPAFFTSLRTNQQLGYIVHAGTTQDEDLLYLIYIVQSADYDAVEIKKRVETFIDSVAIGFSGISDSQFTELKTAVEEELQEEPKNITERGGRQASLAFTYDEDFERREKEFAALKELTHKEVLEILEKAVNKKSSRNVDLLLFAKQHVEKNKGVNAMKDINSFKKTRIYRKVD